jgi:hypothetical protein
MNLDFTVDKVVKVAMISHVNKIIKTWDKACEESDDGFQQVARQRIATAAPEDLFKVDNDASKLSPAEAKSFHSIIVMMLYETKRARPNTTLAVACLTTRVQEPDVDDWRKLGHLIQYLKSTRDLPLILGALHTGVWHWHVDASFATHQNMRGRLGGALIMGTGCADVRSSTIGESVAGNEIKAQILWNRLFIEAQGVKVPDNILNQDNRSAIVLERNGRASSSKRTKHIEIC